MGAPHAIALEERPAQDEGIGQIDVGRRHLQDVDVLLTRHTAQEVCARRVELDLTKHVLVQLAASFGRPP